MTDRKPWLKRLRNLEEEILNRNESGIIACSALKEKV